MYILFEFFCLYYVLEIMTSVWIKDESKRSLLQKRLNKDSCAPPGELVNMNQADAGESSEEPGKVIIIGRVQCVWHQALCTCTERMLWLSYHALWRQRGTCTSMALKIHVWGSDCHMMITYWPCSGHADMRRDSGQKTWGQWIHSAIRFLPFDCY